MDTPGRYGSTDGHEPPPLGRGRGLWTRHSCLRCSLAIRGEESPVCGRGVGVSTHQRAWIGATFDRLRERRLTRAGVVVAVVAVSTFGLAAPALAAAPNVSITGLASGRCVRWRDRVDVQGQEQQQRPDIHRRRSLLHRANSQDVMTCNGSCNFTEELPANGEKSYNATLRAGQLPAGQNPSGESGSSPGPAAIPLNRPPAASRFRGPRRRRRCRRSRALSPTSTRPRRSRRPRSPCRTPARRRTPGKSGPTTRATSRSSLSPGSRSARCHGGHRPEGRHRAVHGDQDGGCRAAPHGLEAHGQALAVTPSAGASVTDPGVSSTVDPLATETPGTSHRPTRAQGSPGC